MVRQGGHVVRVGFALVAALQVMVDTGTTVSMAPYYQVLEVRTPSVKAPLSSAHSPSAFSLVSLLPITTPILSPGNIAERAVNLPHLVRPLFLLGSDALSLAWLRQHHDRLQQCHAIGIVVEVSDSQTWERITHSAQGLPLIPMTGTELARRFHLRHYPVLIEPQRIGP